MAAGHLDAAVDVEVIGREIEHGARASADCRTASISPSVRPRTSAASSMPLESGRRSVAGAFLAGERGKAAAERISVCLGQRVSDDSADVIFAEDGGVELAAIALPACSGGAIGSTVDGELLLFMVGNAEARDHLAQLLPRRDVADADVADLLQVEQGQPSGTARGR